MVLATRWPQYDQILEWLMVLWDDQMSICVVHQWCMILSWLLTLNWLLDSFYLTLNICFVWNRSQNILVHISRRANEETLRPQTTDLIHLIINTQEKSDEDKSDSKWAGHTTFSESHVCFPQCCYKNLNSES